MPEHAKPRTNQARLAFLHAAEQRERCQALLLPDLAKTLYTCHRRFDTLYFRELDMEAERMRLCAERKAAFRELNTLIRHYWQGLRLQVRRGELPVEAFQYIGLNRSGRNLKLVRMQDKMVAARWLVGGTTIMEALGWQLHQQPAACEIDAALIRIRALMTEHDNHLARLTRLRATLKKEARQVDVVYHKVYHGVRLALYGRRAAEKRVTLRQYGVVFRYRPDRDRPLSQSTREVNVAPGQALSNTPDEVRETEDRQQLGHLIPLKALPKPVAKPTVADVSHEERQRQRTRIRQMLRRLHRRKPKRRALVNPAA